MTRLNRKLIKAVLNQHKCARAGTENAIWTFAAKRIQFHKAVETLIGEAAEKCLIVVFWVFFLPLFFLTHSS